VQIASEIGPSLNENTDQEKKERQLSRKTVNALREAGFWKLYLPKSLGGLETDPITTAKIVEEVARHNTAAAWSLMVANTTTWWCGRLNEKGIKEVFQFGPETFIAGSVHPPMKAKQVSGGYSITGRSPLFSNVNEANWIFITAFVMDDDKICMKDGKPEVVGVLMYRSDCEIIDTWYTLGMCATDSNDVSATEVFVPSHRSFSLIPAYEPNDHYKGALYRFPAAGACVGSLIAPVPIALARNAINEVKDIAEKKMPLGSMVAMREKGTAQHKLGKAEALLQSARAFLFNQLSESWKRTLAGEEHTISEKAMLLLASAHANQSCFNAVDLMYSAAGSTAIYTKSKLSQYFTDAEVVRQHGFINESRYETAAQILFGLPPDLPLVLF
jgi:alkylation response protein AidB-like acyl-CoA dehydrogenase